ncbi:MAG TPA: hypothetical protein PLW80_03280 [Spirochaetales bacterium]|nr:hypothetical protein [Spirochaetales bacterium]HPB65555.1 hypothetical protein [Spirochaetales bacterium]HPM71633.1 hypothetical protein [Spirochaetales bacterium]HQO65150.1 hypothetical protein [Spirochaetales bacterium]
MSRRLGVASAAMVVGPLLVAALALPGEADVAAAASIAGGLPLAWAAAVSLAASLDATGLAIALAGALPFGAWALASYAPRPSWPDLVALASAAVAGSVSAFALERSARAGHGRARLVVPIVAMASCAAASELAGPWSGAAVSSLVVVLSSLAFARPR